MLVTAIAPPSTYSDWVDVLDMLKNKYDDEAVLSAMQKGTIEWQSGVAERFARKLIDVINYRMNAASDKFQKEMSRSNGQERAIVQALLSLRKEMRFLSEADSFSLPISSGWREVSLENKSLIASKVSSQVLNFTSLKLKKMTGYLP